jgi:hypothetical protein
LTFGFQVEAAWILTNIACSPKFEHIQAIFDVDVFPQINKLLSSSNDRVYDQALWLLANLIGVVDQPKNERKVAQVSTCQYNTVLSKLGKNAPLKISTTFLCYIFADSFSTANKR